MLRDLVFCVSLSACASHTLTTAAYTQDIPPEALIQESVHRPAFSWATVPQWLIVRKATAFTREEIQLIASAPLVVFEKETGHSDAGFVEDGVLSAARAVKAGNPTTITLFYWNAVINYGNYRANQIFDRNRASWALQKNGKTFLLKNRYPIYNHLDHSFQDWWIATAKGVLSDPAIDGVMIDAICKTDAADDGGKALYPSEEYGRAYVEAATRLKSEVGSKLLIGNAIRASKPQSNLDHLSYLDGSYVERWAVPVGNQSFEDYVAEGMAAMSRALAKGKIILFNSSPEVFGSDQLPAQATYPEREMWMKQHISFALAVFLMIAEEGAYFHWGTGPNVLTGRNADVWRNDIYSDLSRPLGRPLGSAVRRGSVFSRSFEHLDVSVDLKTRQATFGWH